MSTATELREEQQQNLAIDYQIHFGTKQLGDLAIATRNNFLQFARNTLDQLVKVGRELIGIREQTVEQLGIKEGKRAFKQWLDSDEFGGSRYLAQCAMKVASWFDELPPDTQEKVRTNAQDWSASALRELPKLTTSILEALLDQGKQTVQSIKAKTSCKRTNPPIDVKNLSVGETLIFSPLERTQDEQLDNLIGSEVELMEILLNDEVRTMNDENSSLPLVVIRHLDQPEQTYVCSLEEIRKPKLSVSQLEQQILELKEQNQQLMAQLEKKLTQPLLTDDQLYVGAKVVIAHCSQGWQGYTGIISERSRSGDWWVKLDSDNGFVRNLYKASQLDWYIETTKKTSLELKLQAENERLKGRLERLNLSQKEEQSKIKTISNILGNLAQQKGLLGWKEDSYHSVNGKTYYNFIDSLIAFLQDFLAISYQLSAIS